MTDGRRYGWPPFDDRTMIVVRSSGPVPVARMRQFTDWICYDPAAGIVDSWFTDFAGRGISCAIVVRRDGDTEYAVFREPW